MSGRNTPQGAAGAQSGGQDARVVTEEIMIPGFEVGSIVGPGGFNLHNLERECGVSLDVVQTSRAATREPKPLQISGPKLNVARAKERIMQQLKKKGPRDVSSVSLRSEPVYPSSGSAPPTPGYGTILGTGPSGTMIETATVDIFLEGQSSALMELARLAETKVAEVTRFVTLSVNGKPVNIYVKFTVNLVAVDLVIAAGGGQYLSDFRATVSARRSTGERDSVTWVGGKNGRIVVPLKSALERKYDTGVLVTRFKMTVTNLDAFLSAQKHFELAAKPAERKDAPAASKKLPVDVATGNSQPTAGSSKKDTQRTSPEPSRDVHRSPSGKSEPTPPDPHDQGDAKININHPRASTDVSRCSKSEFHGFTSTTIPQDSISKTPIPKEHSSQKSDTSSTSVDSTKGTNFMALFKNGPFKKDDFTDCSIHTADTDCVFYAHRAVLGRQSSVLKTDFVELKKSSVTWDDEEAVDVRKFMEIVYNRDMLVKHSGKLDSLCAIYRLAHRTKITDLLTSCEEEFAAMPIDTESMCSLLQLATVCESESLMDRCVVAGKKLSRRFWLHDMEQFARDQPGVMLKLATHLMGIKD